MTQIDISKKVLEKIKDEGIIPKARWRFAVYNVLLWFVGAVLIFVGMLAVSVIILSFTHGAWDVHRAIGTTIFKHFIMMLPFVWLMVFVLFVWIAECAIVATKKGYRYGFIKISLALVFASIVGGIALYSFGTSTRFDDALGKRIHMYKSIDKRQHYLLHAPEKGRLLGIVTKCENAICTVYNRIDEHLWYVDGRKISQEKQQMLTSDRRLMFFGKKIDRDVFVADDVHVMRRGPKNIKQKHKVQYHGMYKSGQAK